MRRLQTFSMRWMAPAQAERARRGLVRQNAFARRIGLRLVFAFVLVVFVSLTIQAVYATAVYLVESGVLRRRVETLEDLLALDLARLVQIVDHGDGGPEV